MGNLEYNYYIILHTGFTNFFISFLAVSRGGPRTKNGQAFVCKFGCQGTHFGVNRTNATIASKYYWPGLYTDVISCVRL